VRTVDFAERMAKTTPSTGGSDGTRCFGRSQSASGMLQFSLAQLSVAICSAMAMAPTPRPRLRPSDHRQERERGWERGGGGGGGGVGGVGGGWGGRAWVRFCSATVAEGIGAPILPKPTSRSSASASAVYAAQT
jgi:hypothetical protein